MVARRRFSIRVNTGASPSSSFTTSSVSLAVSYEASGAFQLWPAPAASHGSSGPPRVSNGWQMSGGPASAGTAADTMADATAAASGRVILNIDCLLVNQTDSIHHCAVVNE